MDPQSENQLNYVHTKNQGIDQNQIQMKVFAKNNLC